MEEEGRGHMRFAPQILSLLLVVRRGTSHWASRPCPPHCVLERLIYQASSDRWVARGPAVPVTARGITGDLDRRQHQERRPWHRRRLDHTNQQGLWDENTLLPLCL